RAEMLELKSTYVDGRRTKIVGNLDEPEYEAEDFILAEDALVVLTRQGWIKRQREMKDAAATRVREGDSVLEVVAGSTKAAVAYFSNRGTCYVGRLVDVPATTGHGSPLQNVFKLDDGERIIRMMSFDPRVLDVPPEEEGATEPGPPYAIAVTKQGMTMCMSLRGHREPSTRSGRRFMRLDEGDEVIYVGLKQKGAHVACATAEGHALICDADEVSLLAGPGKGVMLIKLGKDDVVVGAQLVYGQRDALVVEKESGAELRVSLEKYKAVSRGGKGHAMFQRGSVAKVVTVPPPVPTLPDEGEK
ncbi:MAG TPA: DNA gyrase C-terminal beta-propeller domain-containing protein, partial [Polyangiales bacterium]|nr:DNA gyrase C-terminal beta-propeller domain-containing protein [Polyangiales bacterium]